MDGSLSSGIGMAAVKVLCSRDCMAFVTTYSITVQLTVVTDLTDCQHTAVYLYTHRHSVVRAYARPPSRGHTHAC